MKTLKVLVCLSFSIFYFSSSFGQTWLWGAGGCSGFGNSGVSPVATDKKGNAYIAATSQVDTVRVGKYVLTGIYDNAYVVKYDSLGNVIWAKNITGIGSFGNSVATDKSGNMYLGGFFYGGPIWADTFELFNPNGESAFLIKFNPNGKVLWAKRSETPSGKSGAGATSVATDNSNNVFLTGTFADTVSFGNVTLKANSRSKFQRVGDVFLVKYDSNGNVLWAKQSEVPSATNGDVNVQCVTTDKLGNSYITGRFNDTISFGAISLHSYGGGYTYFLVKYSVSGNVLWAQQNTYSSYYANSVITDEANNVYITGYSGMNVVANMFLAKYNANGNIIWNKQSSGNWVGTGLASDAHNHIYLTGSNEGLNMSTFDFGWYSLYPNPKSINATFMLKMDTAGNVLCGSMLNNLNIQTIAELASDYTGKYIYTASIIGNGVVVCGPDTLISKGVTPNGFVGRWVPCDDATLGVNTISPQNGSIIAYPNPSNGVFTIVESGKWKMENEKSNIEVYNMLGKKVYSQFSTLNSPFSINLSDEPNGIYFYRVISEQGSLIGDGKLIIQK